MALLDAVTNVAFECGYQVDSSIIGSTDVTTRQLLTIAQRIADDMGNSYAWRELDKSATITLVDGQDTYSLPNDFSYYHYDTFWNTSQRWRVLGPMTPQQYAYIIGSGITPIVESQMMLRGITNKQFLISPTPNSSTAGQIIAFQYVANRVIRPRTWTSGLSVASGAYIFYNGNYYVSTASGTTGVTAPTWTTGTQSDGGVSWTYYDGAYATFLADTDEIVLDQKILEQGMIERFADIKGLSITPKYEVQLNEEFSKNIPGKSIYVGGYPRRFVTAWNGVATFGRDY